MWEALYGATFLDVEAEQDHVSIVDDVFLALEAHLSRLFCSLLAAAGDVVVVTDHFRPDEAALEVGMNHAGGPRSRVAAVDCPRPHLFRSRREISLQPEQAIPRANQAIETRLLQPEIGEKRFLVLVAHLGHLRLDRGADRHDRRAFSLRITLDAFE